MIACLMASLNLALHYLRYVFVEIHAGIRYSTPDLTRSVGCDTDALKHLVRIQHQRAQMSHICISYPWNILADLLNFQSIFHSVPFSSRRRNLAFVRGMKASKGTSAGSGDERFDSCTQSCLSIIWPRVLKNTCLEVACREH